MRSSTLTAAAGGLLLVALAGCGSTGASTPAASSSTSPSPTAASAAATVAAVKVMTAEQVIGSLVSTVPTARAGVDYTAASDPNHLLGRPGGYTSKQAFTDADVRPADAQDDTAGSVDLGGSVEVYSDAAGALARGQYIQKAGAGIGVHEYDYVAGGVLLRVSPVLTPTQAQAYQAALSKAIGAPATALA